MFIPIKRFFKTVALGCHNENTFLFRVSIIRVTFEVGKYSSSPVKTQFGYHIIYKASQGEKPSIDKVKDEVKTKIANDMRSTDSNFNINAIKALREEYGLKITDSDLKKSYESN